MIFNKKGNGTAEVAKYATWTSDHNYIHIEPALKLAKRKVLNIVGKEIYQTALDHYLSDDFEYVLPEPAPEPEPTPEEIAEWLQLDSLVYQLQQIFVNFAYSKNLYKDQVIWDNSGINVVWSDQMRPAQQVTLENLEKSFEKDGYNHLDILIDWLNELASVFPEFQESVAAKRLKGLFINDSKEFSYYHNIDESTSFFFELIAIIRRVQENDIYYALGASWYGKVLDYQEKRLDVATPDFTVNTVADLDDLTPDENDIAFVLENTSYYKYTDVWTLYCFDCRQLLTMIKPALVDLTMYVKLISGIKHYESKEQKQIEIIRASANNLKQQGDIQIGKFALLLQDLEEPIYDDEGEEIPDTDGSLVNVTTNSFLM